MTCKRAAAFFLLLFLPAVSASAYWVWSPETGKFVNPEGAVQDTAEEEYEYAMQFYREKNLDETAKQLENLLKKYPAARIAGEAQYRLGTIYEEQGDYLKSFQAYKVLVESYPQSERFSEVIEREFRIGNVFLSGKKAKLMGLEILPSLPRAAEIFEHIVKNAPYGEFGDQAQFHLGLTYKRWNRFGEASEAFQALIDQYPQSDLVDKARFQLAEVSYNRSVSQFRDQRALEEASVNVDRFLAQYPESEASEKASVIRQAIDEKNAEKNYRIGLYYEKDNYLKSALIYYEDVAKRYPQTQWGQKASEKMRSLQKPDEYVLSQESEIAAEEEQLKTRMAALPKDDKPGRKEIEGRLEQLQDKRDKITKDKDESLERREKDLERRDAELKEKFKNLEKKKAMAEESKSADFQRVMERWEASLVAEREALMAERDRLDQWKKSLGDGDSAHVWDILPFIGEEETPAEKVRQIEAKKLYKISEAKRDLFEEKEGLYKQMEEAEVLLQAMQIEKMGIEREQSEWLERVDVDKRAVVEQQAALREIRAQIEAKENELNDLRGAYQDRYGQSGWKSIAVFPAKVVTVSTGAVAKSITKSIDVLNPFNDAGAGEGVDARSTQELLEIQMHLKEKTAAQQAITETLSNAFDAELAERERQRLLADLESAEGSDPAVLRKSIKKLEKDIRAGYEEIQDRHERKRAMLDELNEMMKQGRLGDPAGMGATGRTVTAPLRLVKSFFVGLPDEDVELTAAAGQAGGEAGARARELKEDIELESIVIDSKSREIAALEKELEILQAKASLQGGQKFRSAFVKVPYEFIGNAISSAKRIVPLKDRDEMLVERLEEETKKLDSYRAELQLVNTELRKRAEADQAAKSAQKAAQKPAREMTALEKLAAELQEPVEGPSVIEPEAAAVSAAESAPSREELEGQIESAVTSIESQQEQYRREKKKLEGQIKELGPDAEPSVQEKIQDKHEEMLLEREEELRGRMDALRSEITELINRESEIEGAEHSILEKRMNYIDKIMKGVQSKAQTQDLLIERDRIQNRLSQLSLRRDFLSRESERFQVTESPRTSS